MVKKSIKNTKAEKQSTVPAKRTAKAVAKGSTAPASAQREVTFAVYEPTAEQVFISGAFNGWSAEATPLTREPNRDWKAKLALPPGRHEYKFVVDGKWKIDPRAHQFSPNGFGTLNSVIEVKA